MNGLINEWKLYSHLYDLLLTLVKINRTKRIIIEEMDSVSESQFKKFFLTDLPIAILIHPFKYSFKVSIDYFESSTNCAISENDIAPLWSMSQYSNAA